VRRRTIFDLGNDDSACQGQIKSLGKLWRQILPLCAEAPTFDFAVLDQLLHDVVGHVDRNRKSDTDITAAATAAEDRGIDTDKFATQVNKRTPRITEVDRSIGLNEILIGFNAKPGATQCRYNTRGHCLSETEGIANGDDKIAHPQATGVGDRHPC